MVPRAKKKKNKKAYSLDFTTGALKLQRMVIYQYLSDMKEFTQEDIKKLDLYITRVTMYLENGLVDFDDISRGLNDNGIDLKDIRETTDKYIDEYKDKMIEL